MDRGMVYQQNITEIDLCIIVLFAVSNDIEDLPPLVPDINTALNNFAPGQLIQVRQ